MPKKLVRLLLLFIAGVVLFFVVVANYSEEVTQYSCLGTYKTKNETEEPGEVFIKVNKYRWWVGIWNDKSDGTIFVEYRKGIDPNTKIPLSYIDHLLDTSHAEGVIHIRDSKMTPAGAFYLLSGSVTLKSTYGWFDGKCSKIH